MPEKLVSSESPFGKQWIMYGKFPGLKTEELRDLHRLNPSGVMVLPGISIGASYYLDYLACNNGSSGEVLPLNLTLVNKHILKMAPVSQPLAVRSSATDEKGGTGEYESVFIIPTGDAVEDLRRLETAERTVYASFQKTGDSKGMGILIQPVVGNNFGDYFMPILAGVHTTENGEPLLRLIVGLGTKAVTLDEALVFKGNLSLDEVEQKISSLRRAAVIDLQTGQVIQVDIPRDISRVASIKAHKVISLKDSWESLSSGENKYYWEFAADCSDNPPFIVQSSTEKVQEQRDVEFGEREGKVLCEGTDVVNQGIKTGRGVFVVGEHVFDPNDLGIISNLNSGSKDHLLILRDVAFSGLTGGRPLVSLGHFNNAAAVVELQFERPQDSSAFSFTLDHSRGKGGSHFSEVCKRKDILFVGVRVGNEGIHSQAIMGQMTKKYGFGIEYWDVPFKVTNTRERGRVEIIGPATELNPLAENLDLWEGSLYDMASAVSRNAINDNERRISDSLYAVFSYICDAEEAVSQTGDPFGFIGSKDPKDIAGMLGDIQEVLLFVGMIEDCDPSSYSRYWTTEIEPFEAFLKQLYWKLSEIKPK